MVSLKLLIDLNELPDSPISSPSMSPATTTTTTATNLIAPKIEPKTEPLDDWNPDWLSSSTVNHAPADYLLQQATLSSTTENVLATFSQIVNGNSPVVSAAEAGAIVPAAIAASTTTTTTTTNPIAPKIDPKPEPLDDWNPNALSPLRQAIPSSTPGNVLVRFSQTVNGNSPAASAAEAGAIVPGLPAAVAPIQLPKRLKRQLMRWAGINSPEMCNYYLDLVRKTRMLYDSLRLFDMFETEKRLGPGMGRRLRSDLRASSFLRDHNFWLHHDKKLLGSVPGISVGDIFLFRMEMCVLGLHGQPQAGIDYLIANDSETGYPIATSVIVSGGYEDDADHGEVLTYSGHGGRDRHNRPFCDQRLEGGNLALFKTMEHGFALRVIRGFRCDGHKVYVYDGLYRVTRAWRDVGKSGFRVYKFRLDRFGGQEEMGSSRIRTAYLLRTRPLVVRPKGYLTFDLSVKKERVPVYLFNDVDSDSGPMEVEYLPRAVFPGSLYQASNGGAGCDCTGGCKFDCLCVIKNGGEIPYDHQGFLVRGKPVVFECGVNCDCPPDCRNRVSQRGLRHRLEVFKSQGRGWRVRTLEVIQAGSFICEYSGLVVDREQASIFSMAGDKLTYPGQFAPKWAEWGDLSRVFSNRVIPSFPSLPPLDFAIDTSSMRNVAFYIGHSANPNVMVQFVMYDHSNLIFPHVMLFALETIPPMKELTIDYGKPDEPNEKLSICHH